VPAGRWARCHTSAHHTQLTFSWRLDPEHAAVGQRAGQLVLGGQHAARHLAKDVRCRRALTRPRHWLSQLSALGTFFIERGARRSRASLIRSKYEMKAWAAKTPIEATPPTRSPTAATILGLSAEPASGAGEVRSGGRLFTANRAHAHPLLQHLVGKVRSNI